MKRLLLSLTLAIVTILLIAIPVLASCYAYIYIEESNGNSYDDLPLICSTNISALVQGGFISSTGLDTRVITGDGDPLPHMLANDKILFVSDLEAYEDKTLIFYTGATSLSSFPIIVGYNGYITTPDDPDLELTYVIELLVDGYFDASAGSNKNILYKEDAFKINISAANTLRVAALEAGDVEQWEMHYSSFTSGEHTIYVMANGLVAYLYVDAFDVAKDTANLFDSTSYQCINKGITTYARCFYDEGYYWVFYRYDSNNIGYITSADGLSWSGETTIPVASGDDISDMDIKMRDEYIHISYVDAVGTDYVRYRRGDLTSSPGITWSAGWQTVTSGATNPVDTFIAIDTNDYPYILWEEADNYAYCSKSSTNDGTWATAGGYPFEVFHYGAVNNGIPRGFIHYPNSDKLFIMWVYRSGGGAYYNTFARYYNGSSWEPQDDISSYVGNAYGASMAADDDDNLYIGWNLDGGGTDQELAVRYDGEVWDTLTINTNGDTYWPHLCYNKDNNVLYIIYGYENGGDYVYCATLDTDAMELNTPVSIMPLLDDTLRGTNPYEDHIGFLLSDPPNTYHGLIDLTTYQWNDNSNNWTWMMNNVMPYMSDAIIAVDGVSQLEYKPATIIQGTTLPDEESDHDGTITWGSNPSGVAVSHSELICEETGESASYYYFEPGSEDIIKPEPAEITGGMDLEALRDNPLYPLVQVLSIDGFLNERLVWLGIAWFIVLIAMLGVHLGFDTRPNTEKPQHFILTTITGLGLSIIFYTMGIFDLWVIIMMGILLGGAIIWERQPVI